MSRSERRSRFAAAAGILLAALLLAGCRQVMADQPSYRPYDPSTFFPDGASARPLPQGVVPRGGSRADLALYTGKDATGKDVTDFPFPITATVLARGQEEFNVFCAPCHDRTGSGLGLVVRRGFLQPPTLHSDRLRAAPVGHFFDVISNGFGAMPTYADQITVRDRWAIIAYIRALQLSQHASLNDVPPQDRGQLNGGTPQP